MREVTSKNNNITLLILIYRIADDHGPCARDYETNLYFPVLMVFTIELLAVIFLVDQGNSMRFGYLEWKHLHGIKIHNKIDKR